MNGLFVEALVRAAWQGGLIAAVAFGLTRAFPRTPTRVRAWAWWLVCARFAIAPLMPFAVPLPLLHAKAEALPRLVVLPHVAFAHAALAPVALAAPARSPEVPWALILFAAWLIGAAIAIERLIVQHREVRRLARETTPVTDAHALAILTKLCGRLGLTRAPTLLASAQVSSPLVTGLRRPRVLVPHDALAELSAESLEMSLAHELAHLENHDLWLGWVPAIAQVIWWFFPIVRLCGREFAQAREEACDAAAVAITGVAPAAYGDLLLAFGVSAQPIAASAACAASPRFHHLRRRLLMLQHFSSRRLGRGWLLAGAGFALALMPFRVTAQTSALPPPPPSSIADAVPPVPPVPPAPGVAVASNVPPPPAPPDAPEPPDVDGNFHVALIHGDSANMSGTSEDLEHARGFRSKYGDHYLWARMNGHEYIVRDPEALKPVQAFEAQQSKLGEQQDALGKKQDALGEQQDALGKQQDGLGAQQDKLGEQLDALGQQLGALGSQMDGASEKQRDELHAKMQKLNEQMRGLSEKMRALGQQMGELGRQQGGFGRQMGELGRQQGQLGREQGRLARQMMRELRHILDREIASGRAVQVR